jgi:hypothetical protein
LPQGPAEEVHQVAHVVGQYGVHRAVAVLADVVEPIDGVALVGSCLGTLPRHMALEVAQARAVRLFFVPSTSTPRLVLTQSLTLPALPYSPGMPQR